MIEGINKIVNCMSNNQKDMLIIQMLFVVLRGNGATEKSIEELVLAVKKEIK